MSREIVIAGICLLFTIGIGWLADHPHKVVGTVLIVIAFAIVAIVSWRQHAIQNATSAEA